MRQRAGLRRWVRARLSPATAAVPLHQSSHPSAVSPPACAARCAAAAPPLPSRSPSLPLVLRVPSCGTTISCVRVGVSRAVLCVGRDLRVFSLSSGRQLGTVSRAAGGVIGTVDVCDDVGLVVCGSRDCTLRWFDFDSFACQRVSARRSQHTDSVSTVRFVPGTSGRRVVSSGLDGTVKLWDTETGQSVSASSDDSSASASVGSVAVPRPRLSECRQLCDGCDVCR